MKSKEQQIATRVSVVSIIANVILSLLKLMAGIIAQSGAMISDAVHSASDVFSTIIVIIGITISNKSSDKDHQYGHERLECVASVILAVILFLTGLSIGYTGVKKITSGHYEALAMPGMLALIAAVVSIVVKELMYQYTKRAAKQIRSDALMADAWHHRSDALSSIGAFIGIFGARLGYKVLDPIASVVICLFIAKAAYDIFKDSIDKMVDKSCDEETVLRIKDIVSSTEGVIAVDEVRTRLFGPKMYVDVEISCDGDMKLRDAHNIAENVHDRIEEQIGEVKHCMVHVNPADDGEHNNSYKA